MPKASKETASQVEDMGVMEGRYGGARRLHGRVRDVPRGRRRDAAVQGSARTIAARARTGATCCAGKLTFRYADHDEVYEAGDAYYAPPGHVPVSDGRDRDRRVQPDRASTRRRQEVLARNLAAGRRAER